MSNQTHKGVREVLATENFVTEDSHIILPNGSHTRIYLDKSAVVANPLVLDTLGGFLGHLFAHDSVRIVVSTTGCAEAFGKVVARWLSIIELVDVRYVSAIEADDGTFSFTAEDAARITGRRVLIVEDIITFGNAVQNLLTAVEKVGGHVIGIGAVWNRGPMGAEGLEVPLRSLINIPAEVYHPEDGPPCPMCAEGIPIAKDLWAAKTTAEA